ncbi:MAG: bifunctional response regulator/alkaline phosphatase family protein, partial [bacterium]
MAKRKSKILWVDDEIDHLKPHILFLEERGYSVTPLTNAEDAISYIKKEYFDLILLDEMMPGLQGLEAVSILKDINPSLPIILITKSEEENLMEEAIGENIDDYLTKPVNPSQILSSCKRILDKKRIADEKLIRDHTQEFQRISSLLNKSISFKEWINIYTSLAERMINVDNFPNPDLRQIINDQLKECNIVFGNYIEENYSGWVKEQERPVLSPDVIAKYVIPLLKREQRILFVLIDNLRVDQWMSIEPMLYDFFNIKREYYYSILPTATPYSRNSIFAGMFPYEIEKIYPELWKLSDDDEFSQNRYEDKFLGEQL